MTNKEDMFRGFYGNYLYYTTEEERLQCIPLLEKWAEYTAYHFRYSKDDDDHKEFEYIIDDKEFIIKDPYEGEPKPSWSIGIRFSIYKKHLDEANGR